MTKKQEQAVNTPLLVYNYKEAVAAVGYHNAVSYTHLLGANAPLHHAHMAAAEPHQKALAHAARAGQRFHAAGF